MAEHIESGSLTDLILDDTVEAGRRDPKGFNQFLTHLVLGIESINNKRATERRLGHKIDGWPSVDYTKPITPGQAALVRDVASAAIGGYLTTAEAHTTLADNLYTYEA